MEKKYSVWLEFPGYQAIVDELAAEAGNPSFHPHLTLIGDTGLPLDETKTLVAHITAMIDPVHADFTRFDTKHEEWRYFCLVSKRTRPLRGLFDSLHFVFPAAKSEHFRSWPHVSLLYGTPGAQKLWPEPVWALSGRYGKRLFGRRPANRLAIWQTGGPVETWKQEAAFDASA